MTFLLNMKKYLLITVLILCHGCSIDDSNIVKATNGQLEDVSSVSKMQSELIFEKSKVFPNNTQVSIAIIENGIAKYYGINRDDDTIFTFDNHNNVFEIGSISKVFTSTLLAGLVVDNKIELNNPINDYLNFSLKDDSIITFKQLANHTSGLPRLPTNLYPVVNSNNPYKEYNEEKLIEYLTEALTVKSPSSRKYEYSNLGGGLLGYTLTQIENSDYEDLIQSKIFSKYQMTSSTTNRNIVENTLIKGLDDEGREVSNWDLGVLVGAGGVLSTIEDLTKFAIAQFDDSNKELALTREKTGTLNGKALGVDFTGIGLGWHIVNMESVENLHWHNGGTGGYSSSMVIDTKNKNAVIILSNVSAFNENSKNISELSFELMDTLERK